MSIKDKISSMIFGLENEEMEEEFEEAEEEEIIEPKASKAKIGYSSRSSYATDKKVVNISTTAQLQVVMVQPKKFEDVSEMADHLLEKRTVVLNLEMVSKDDKRRIIDFLRGVTYAINGNGKKIAPNAYLMTPYNVGLMGEEIKNEYESGRLSFTQDEE